jgi:tetratricopeptide (TPR) repeat protein
MSEQSKVLAEKAKELRKEGSLEEALIAARAGAAEDDDCISSWYQVALNSEDLQKTQQALEAYEKLLELNDEFAYGWARYGNLLKKMKRESEAIDAYEMALIWDDTEQTAMLGLINLYASNSELIDKEKQFDVLKKYDEVYGLTTINNINVLGNGHLHRENYIEAINCYRKCLKENNFPYARHNLGIAYSCLNEYLNALDILVENQALYPDYEPTRKNITTYTDIINKNKKDIGEDSSNLLDNKEYYDTYINPFELLEANREDDIEEFDVKQIQRLRKNLLQELELEDGVLPWMEGLTFDKSKIIACLDDLNDETTKEYHWRIYKDENLLNFLTKGKINLFTDIPSQELIDIRIEIRDDEEFSSWVGKYFSKMYDKIFNIAVQKNRYKLIKLLLGGRRLVAEYQADLCYEKSHQSLSDLIQQFRDAENQAEKMLPSFDAIQTSISDAGLHEFFTKLPYQFKDLQNEFAQILRNISILCNNEHDDSELSKKFLEIAKAYAPKNSTLALKIREDESQIGEIIAKEKKKESHLTFGSTSSSITKDGVKYGHSILKPKEISSIRWGVLITNGNYFRTYNFLLAAKGNGKEININWDAVKDIEKQQDLYEKQIEAMIQFIFPSVLERIKEKLESGASEAIGPCRIYKDRVQFETKGWFSTKNHVLNWNQIKTELKSGMLVLYDKRDPSVKVEMSLRDTDNAFVLHILAMN